MTERTLPPGADQYVARAVELALNNAERRLRPYGAVVVQDGQVIGEGVNTVLLDGDPTAHAEVAAVRDACRRTGGRDLSGAYLASSCRPCELCQAAIRLVGIDLVLYAYVPAVGVERPELVMELVADDRAEVPFTVFGLSGQPTVDRVGQR